MKDCAESSRGGRIKVVRQHVFQQTASVAAGK